MLWLIKEIHAYHFLVIVYNREMHNIAYNAVKAINLIFLQQVIFKIAPYSLTCKIRL